MPPGRTPRSALNVLIAGIIALGPAAMGPARAAEADPSQAFFTRHCQACHTGQAGALSTPLIGRFGTQVALKEGQPVIMDDKYIRESILDPGVLVTQGYQPMMPVYRGLISEEGIMQIIEFLKSGREPTTTAPATATAPS